MLSVSSSLVESDRTSNHILAEVVKYIKREMKSICSVSHDLILRD